MTEAPSIKKSSSGWRREFNSARPVSDMGPYGDDIIIERARLAIKVGLFEQSPAYSCVEQWTALGLLQWNTSTDHQGGRLFDVIKLVLGKEKSV